MIPRLARSAVAASSVAAPGATTVTAMSSARRRGFFPPALAGYGPGRPVETIPVHSRGAATLTARTAEADDEVVTTVGTVAGDLANPAPMPPRQKMPLGSDRRLDTGPDGVGPSAPPSQPVGATTVLAASASEPSESSAEPAPQADEAAALTTTTTTTTSDDNVPPPHPQRPPQPPSIIHALLERPFAPLPIDLVQYFEERPHMYSPTDASALAAYAVQMNDFATARRAHRLLFTERMPTLLAPPPQATDVPDSRSYSPRNHEEAERRPRNHLRVHSRLAPNGLDGVPNYDLTAKYGAKRQVNVRLAKLLPPIWRLPKTAPRERVTPDQVLCHEHYLLLMNKGAPLATALKSLRATTKGATLRHELTLLELHLAYTDAAPEPILDAFSCLSRAAWTRQTLHLAVLALLRVLTTPTSETEPSKDTPGPNVARLDALRRRFFQPKAITKLLTLGSESWRHVLLRAAKLNDEELGHFAWTRGRKQLGHERMQLEKERATTFAPRHPAQPERYGHSALLDADAAAPPAVRARHMGRNVERWGRALSAVALTRGWAECGDAVPLEKAGRVPLAIERWGWVGRDPEAVARVRGAAKAAKRAAHLERVEAEMAEELEKAETQRLRQRARGRGEVGRTLDLATLLQNSRQPEPEVEADVEAEAQVDTATRDDDDEWASVNIRDFYK